MAWPIPGQHTDIAALCNCFDKIATAVVNITVNAMSLKVYNTITGIKEDFTPVNEGKVKIWT